MSSIKEKPEECSAANAEVYKEYTYDNGKVLRLNKEEFERIVNAFLALHRQKQITAK